MNTTDPVTAQLSLPGAYSNFELHGRPEASQVYIDEHGHEAVDLILGDRVEGTATGRPRLTVGTLAEIDDLEAVVQEARAHWCLWVLDHPERGAA
jgi:hypothetical protein